MSGLTTTSRITYKDTVMTDNSTLEGTTATTQPQYEKSQHNTRTPTKQINAPNIIHKNPLMSSVSPITSNFGTEQKIQAVTLENTRWKHELDQRQATFQAQ